MSAIEIYNKPAFAYREETFTILALNAWELLLKAKLLEINKNKLRCLHIYSTREIAPTVQSKKLYVKRNRTGNKMTVGIDQCFVRLEAEKVTVPEAVKKNLAALIEVRDNAIHFINAGPRLSKQVLEIGTACLRNFIELGKQWLNLDLSSYSLYLMPIGFLPSAEATGRHDSPLDCLQKAVFDSVEKFSRGASQADDITLLLVRYRAATQTAAS